MSIAEAILRTLESPNVTDSNFEPANVVDVLARLSRATFSVADAITDQDGVRANEHWSCTSLTSAVVGMTKGLFAISESINSLAEAVRERDLPASNIAAGELDEYRELHKKNQEEIYRLRRQVEELQGRHQALDEATEQAQKLDMGY